MAIITLLTDFGTTDGYVGAMKGVLLNHARRATIVDITHDVAPQDVLAGSWALCEAAPWFPAGTIHLAVVDPGVGTARAALILLAGGQLFVGPDNGLLDAAARRLDPSVEAWRIDPRRCGSSSGEPSATFHGRDIFAPVAGRLAAGMPAGACGDRIESWHRLENPQPTVVDGLIAGEVIHVDRFGNLITNIARRDLEGQGSEGGVLECIVMLGNRRIGRVRETFGSVAQGAWVAYVGSSDLLEIAVRDGHAAAASGLGRGGAVRCLQAEDQR